MTPRQDLCQPEAVIDSVYFPETGMISQVSNLDEGEQAEVGVIGREGMLGSALISGVETSYTEAMVQLAGTALRMSAPDFSREMEQNLAFRELLLRYSEAFQAQIMQTAACNGRHPLEQRLARWLLMAQDRSGEEQLVLTQEFLAMMLGVHRPSITISARRMQHAGLIRFSAGRVTILDRDLLEARCCECYGAVTRRFLALLGPSFG
ncbi:Crp/Fnr family transcriptional regulator [Acidisoma cellulosilytica]|uniref:Crp/Fnr family transcriptional regulator n=2 Tax=Acidisoma cellulosilyticum TaxID=2802395 RepID=A0A963Z5F0_9PROT|nr:Crp/Fnr family transcriptional regulator [Acidisoma cellulosilyticum]